MAAKNGRKVSSRLQSELSVAKGGDRSGSGPHSWYLYNKTNLKVNSIGPRGLYNEVLRFDSSFL